VSKAAIARLIQGVEELSEPLATGDADPAGGAVLALVATWAASVVAAAADRSRSGWDGAAGAVAQAHALRRRSLALAERAVDAYEVARAVLAERHSVADPGQGDARDWRLGQVVRRAAEPPLELAACALDIAELSQLVASHAADEIRTDAVIAAMLAAGAARAAAHLVEINLVVGGEKQLAALARSHADAATAAADAAATAGR
jgi:methenyltetrahydrofolate cyclohydrolase